MSTTGLIFSRLAPRPSDSASSSPPNMLDPLEKKSKHAGARRPQKPTWLGPPKEGTRGRKEGDGGDHEEGDVGEHVAGEVLHGDAQVLHVPVDHDALPVAGTSTTRSSCPIAQLRMADLLAVDYDQLESSGRTTPEGGCETNKASIDRKDNMLAETYTPSIGPDR
jgi:hypothetical protein